MDIQLVNEPLFEMLGFVKGLSCFVVKDRCRRLFTIKLMRIKQNMNFRGIATGNSNIIFNSVLKGGGGETDVS